MARISDVMTSSRDTSPDPITLPSSPLGSRSPRKTRAETVNMFSPRKTRASATPSKSLVLDTPNAGDASPWRIKVTVEAEPRDGSPAKRITRTTTVPIKDETKRRSGSPVKRAMSNIKSDAEIKRPARKRKGTPMRDGRSRRAQPEPAPTPDEDEALPPPSHSPARRASGRLARLSVASNSSRSKRLSVAREELDHALQSALGYSDKPYGYDVPGDKTVSLNEDFSIISVDSLQSAKEASLANIMQTIPEGEIAANAPLAKSSSLKVHYPDISGKAAEARSSPTNHYEPMSWRPTGKAKLSSLPSVKRQDRSIPYEVEWQLERNAVSQQIRNASAGDVFVVDDQADDDDDEDLEDDEPVHDAAGALDDIWQDEASRSIDEDHHTGVGSRNERSDPMEGPNRSPRFGNLFADEAQKPLRSKIPRTWRRSSGMDFTYVDSPAHETIPKPTEERRHSTDGSGVLTPPSTTDDDEHESDAVMEDDVIDEVESEFQPDAEATRVQDQMDGDEPGAFSSPPREEAASPLSDSGSSSSSSDGNDAGGFFSSNMPSLFNNNQRPRRRPPKQKTMDLTELLNLDGANSPVKSPVKHAKSNLQDSFKGRSANHSTRANRSPLQMRPVLGHVKSSPGDSSRDKVISSPLRKSLLRSSKMHGSPLKRDEKKAMHMPFPSANPEEAPRRSFFKTQDEETMGESFASKESDQRQLLRENAANQYEGHYHTSQIDVEKSNADKYVYPDSDGTREAQHRGYRDGHHTGRCQDCEGGEDCRNASKSYEERLNVESPQKIRVNFNDMTGSSLLDHKKEYPPLFGNTDPVPQPLPRTDSSGTITLIEKQSAKNAISGPGILSRLSQTFWSAVVKPTGSALFVSDPEPPVSFPADLRTQLRRRYGVASENFPWTMYHMRVIHRMLNSLTSNHYDSIIPRSGSLPSYLTKIINTWQTSITDYEWLFTTAHAYVVWSFYQILVPQHLIDAMEWGEIEWLGDGMARDCRGYYGKDTRHGSQPVWTSQKIVGTIEQYVESMQGKIGLEFIVKALGTAVYANAALAKREGLPFEQLQRLGKA